jgi:two-component system nitrogen regulation response regulator GlnG
LARAKGGTILIEEISDIPQDVQARIVRMMDATSETPPRFLAPSQVDISAAMDQESLRQDLFYRLSGATLTVPSLRERVDDIATLTEHFLSRAEAAGGAARHVSEEAMEILRGYSWPGNVRQLENTIRRLCLTGRAEEITRAEIEATLGGQPDAAPILTGSDSESLSASVARHLQRYFDLHGNQLPPEGLYQRILHQVEVPLIEIALTATAGNQAKCADLLGINRNTLRKKITELDIEVTRRRKLM